MVTCFWGGVSKFSLTGGQGLTGGHPPVNLSASKALSASKRKLISGVGRGRFPAGSACVSYSTFLFTGYVFAALTEVGNCHVGSVRDETSSFVQTSSIGHKSGSSIQTGSVRHQSSPSVQTFLQPFFYDRETTPLSNFINF